MRTFYFDFHVSDAYVFGQSPTERGCTRQAAGNAGRMLARRFTSAVDARLSGLLVHFEPPGVGVLKHITQIGDLVGRHRLGRALK